LTIGTTTLAELTTSSYGPASGEIPGTYSPYEGPTICFYVPYAFHIESSAQKIIGTISGSNPFNFYIMSKYQYDAFVGGAPPCGSSYHALKLDYSIKEFDVDWAAPSPGDYYIILENTSKYLITYTIRLGVIEPASSLVYSTTAVIQTFTFTQQQAINTTIIRSASTIEATKSDITVPIVTVLVVALIIAAILVRRFKMKKQSQSPSIRK
jgi:hypothetical protein